MSRMREESCFLSNDFNSVNLLIFKIVIDFIFICCSIDIWYTITM